jgi:hypothetical protein
METNRTDERTNDRIRYPLCSKDTVHMEDHAGTSVAGPETIISATISPPRQTTSRSSYLVGQGVRKLDPEAVCGHTRASTEHGPPPFNQVARSTDIRTLSPCPPPAPPLPDSRIPAPPTFLHSHRKRVPMSHGFRNQPMNHMCCIWGFLLMCSSTLPYVSCGTCPRAIRREWGRGGGSAGNGVDKAGLPIRRATLGGDLPARVRADLPLRDVSLKVLSARVRDPPPGLLQGLLHTARPARIDRDVSKPSRRSSEQCATLSLDLPYRVPFPRDRLTCPFRHLLVAPTFSRLSSSTTPPHPPPHAAGGPAGRPSGRRRRSR